MHRALIWLVLIAIEIGLYFGAAYYLPLQLILLFFGV